MAKEIKPEGGEPQASPSNSEKKGYKLVDLPADTRHVYVPQTGREYDLTKDLHPAEVAQLLEAGWPHIAKDE